MMAESSLAYTFRLTVPGSFGFSVSLVLVREARVTLRMRLKAIMPAPPTLSSSPLFCPPHPTEPVTAAMRGLESMPGVSTVAAMVSMPRAISIVESLTEAVVVEGSFGVPIRLTPIAIP